jgi:hypothetical protein
MSSLYCLELLQFFHCIFKRLDLPVCGCHECCELGILQARAATQAAAISHLQTVIPETHALQQSCW